MLDLRRVRPAHLLLAGVLATLAAARTPGVFQVDEYFQVVEPASHLLGRTPFEALTWEFQERIRPWLQPAFYALLGRGAGAAGVTDPFALLLLWRLATGLVSWAAIGVTWRAVAPGLRDPRSRTLLAASLGLAWFVPFLAVRTSGETLSGALLLLGLALRLRADGGGGDPGGLRAWGSGLALGLAVQARYQVGFAVLGIAAHALLCSPPGRRLRALLPLAAGIALATAAGAAVDAHAYGAPVLAAWNYLRVNVVEGRASTFGTLPLPAYLVLMLGVFPPFGALLMAGLLVLWWRRPRHLLTFATLPFFLAHSLVAHKEARFLFPLLLPALVGLVLLWDEPEAASGRGAAALAWLRRAWVHPVALGLAAVGLVLACALPSPDNLELQRFVHRRAGDRARWCAFVDPARFHRTLAPFVRPARPPELHPVANLEELEACAAEGAASGLPALVLLKHPPPPGVEPWLEARGERVFSALPAWVARLDLAGWVGRADATAAYRLPAPGGGEAR